MVRCKPDVSICRLRNRYRRPYESTNKQHDITWFRPRQNTNFS